LTKVQYSLNPFKIKAHIMSKLNFSTLLKNHMRKREETGLVKIDIDGIVFDVIPLSEQLKDLFMECESYKDMLCFAANHGVAVDYEPVYLNPELSESMESAWGDDQMPEDSDPCIQYRVGEYIAEISGLADLLEEARTIDGDNLPDLNTELGQLEADRIAQEA
jgi:hypothetical protein